MASLWTLCCIVGFTLAISDSVLSADYTEDIVHRDKRFYIEGWSQDTSKVALNEEEKIAIILIHNALRRQVSPTATNMAFLIWADYLAVEAQQWSTGCDFQHNYGNDYGENLAVQSSYYNVTDMVTGWFSEGESYDYSSHTCSTATCAHYHQVSLAESRFFGCGMTFCPSMSTVSMTNGYYLVCNYDPAQNRGSSVPYESGSSCSNCPSAYPVCEDSLCRSDPVCGGLSCNNGGVLVSPLCSCDCSGTGESPPTCGEASNGGGGGGGDGGGDSNNETGNLNYNNNTGNGVMKTLSPCWNAMFALVTTHLFSHALFTYI